MGSPKELYNFAHKKARGNAPALIIIELKIEWILRYKMLNGTFTRIATLLPGLRA